MRASSASLAKTASLTKSSCITLLLCVLISGCASGPPKKTENLCAVFSQKSGWQGAALKQQKKWGTPMFPALAIMKQESSFRSEAQPPRRYYLGFIPGPRPSSAYGYSQALKGTWKFYIKDTGEYWRKRNDFVDALDFICLLYTSPSPRDATLSRMPSSA